MAALVASLTPQELDALSSVPALAPPPGVQSNFVNPPNQSLSFFIVTGILLVAMVLFFLNRLYTKLIIIRKHSWDDLTIVLAFISAIAYYVVIVWSVQRGKLGLHQWDINIPDILSLDLLIPEYLASILTEIALLFTKITFFFMYLDIFNPKRWMRISAWLGIAITFAFYLAVLVANLIFSTPRSGQSWAEAAFNEQGTLSLSIPQAVIGLAIDLYILILPVIAVSKLQLPTQRKIGVMAIFMSGLLAVAASILKSYYSNVLINTTDLTFAALPINIVTFTEISVGISCACMPCAAHTFRHLLPSLGRVKSILSRYIQSISLKSTLRSNSPESFASERKGWTEQGVRHDRNYNSSASLDPQWRPPVPPKDPVRPFVRSGRQNDLEQGSGGVTGMYRSHEIEIKYAGGEARMGRLR